MSDRPIIFSAPMVRALLDGRKTQTRRILKLPPAPERLGRWEASTVGGGGVTDRQGRPVPERPCVWHTRTGTVVAPGYAVGDRLWVRESSSASADSDEISGVRYAADGAFFPIENTLSAAELWLAMHWYARSADDDLRRDGKVVPSIHMPRWASRLILTVERVRVERLQDISEADAKAEGAEHAYGEGSTISHRRMFDLLWRHLHGPESWDANPFVVALTFRVERGNIDRLAA